MFTELTDELMDLRAAVRTSGAAPYASAADETGCGACSSCSWILCTCSWPPCW